MSNRLPAADYKFIADFAAFCRTKGDEEYCYSFPRFCALAQFLNETGRSELEMQPCGVHRPYGLNWWPTDGSALYRALNPGDGYTFSALADRLDALLIDAPVVSVQQ